MYDVVSFLDSESLRWLGEYEMDLFTESNVPIVIEIASSGVVCFAVEERRSNSRFSTVKLPKI